MKIKAIGIESNWKKIDDKQVKHKLCCDTLEQLEEN